MSFYRTRVEDCIQGGVFLRGHRRAARGERCDKKEASIKAEISEGRTSFNVEKKRLRGGRGQRKFLERGGGRL